ncbi:MAG: hypothetical protein ACFCVF_16835 [Kineosporiaceae bacterium]
MHDGTYDDPTDPTERGRLTPRVHQVAELDGLLDEVLAFARALAPLREEAATGPPGT